MHKQGHTVHWYNGRHWCEYQFVGHYPEAQAVKIRNGSGVRTVNWWEVISHPLYLEEKQRERAARGAR